MQHEAVQKVWGAQLPIASEGRNGLAERTAPVRVYKCALVPRELSRAFAGTLLFLEKSFDLIARHRYNFGKDAFQNGPAFNKSMRPCFALRVGFQAGEFSPARLLVSVTLP